MKIKIGLMLAVLVAAVIAPYFIKGSDGQPLMSFDSPAPDILSSEETRQQFVKWQDASGVWHFGETAPDGVQSETVHVDTAANIIRSVKIEKPTAKTSSAKSTEITQPSLPMPMTISPDKVGKLIEDAQNVENLMNDRIEQIDNISR